MSCCCCYSGSGGGGVDTFVALNDTPASYAGASLQGVRVNAAETGLEFFTVAASTFLGLTDTPNDYTGQSLRSVRVNAGETGLEFFDPSFSFLDLTDTPGSYAGQSLQGVRVNAGETGLEFYTITTGAPSVGSADELNTADGGGAWQAAGVFVQVIGPMNPAILFPDLGTVRAQAGALSLTSSAEASLAGDTATVLRSAGNAGLRLDGTGNFDAAAVGTVLTKTGPNSAQMLPVPGGGGGGLGIRTLPLALANDTYFFGNGGDGVFQCCGVIVPSDGTVNALLVYLNQAGSGTLNVGLYDNTGTLIATSLDGYKAPVVGSNIFSIPSTALNGSDVVYIGCCSRLNGSQFRGVTGALVGGPTPFVAIEDQNGNAGASMRASFNPNSGSTSDRLYGLIGQT